MLQREAIPSNHYIYIHLFSTQDAGYISLKKQAVRESLGLCTSKDRACAWKIFLGYYSTPPKKEQWILEAKTHRARYDELYAQHCSSFERESKRDSWDEDAQSMHLAANNPLSQNTDSPWFKYFEREELKKCIRQDVDRTYPEVEFFHQAWLKDMQFDILFLWSLENSGLSYKQGMHELLAVLMYTLYQGQGQESVTLENLTAENEMNYLISPAYLAHDCYILFDKVMKKIGYLFEGTVEEDSDTNAITKRCIKIYNEILRTRDPSLYSYLTYLNIEPQVYMLRWVRLLFCREFPLETTLLLWDAILGYDKEYSLVEFIACSMLITIRDKLLDSDENAVLGLLFRYPAQTSHEVIEIIQKALALQKPHTITEHATKFVEKFTSSDLPYKNKDKEAEANLEKIQQKWDLFIASSNGEIKTGKDLPNKKFDPNEVEEDFNASLSNRMKVIIDVFQELLFVTAADTAPDKAFIALAELKAIKDVLNGNLSKENFASLMEMHDLTAMHEETKLSLPKY